MKTLWLRWFGVLVVVFGMAASASAIPPMYTVDYKLLVLLHPKMAEFDLTLGRHLKPGVQVSDQKTRDALAREMEALNVEAKKTVDLQQQVIAKLSQEQSEAGAAMRSRVIDVKPGSTASAALPVVMWEEEQKRRAALQKRIDDARHLQEEALDRVFDPMYLTRAESQAIIDGALAEVDGLLERLSEEKGGALILDADFVRGAPVPVRFHPAVSPCLDLVNIGLRQSLLEYDFSNDKMPDLYTKRPELQAKFAEAMQRMKGFESGIATTLSHYPGVAAALGARGRLILAGGKQQDLTRQVLGDLYKKYQVRDEVTSKLLGLVCPTDGTPGEGVKPAAADRNVPASGASVLPGLK